MSTDLKTISFKKILSHVRTCLDVPNRLDLAWEDWGFNQKEGIDMWIDPRNGVLTLFLNTRDIALLFLPPNFQLKDIVYVDIVDGLGLQEKNFLLVAIGKTIDKFTFCSAEGRPICRMPLSVFVAPPAHQAISTHFEDMTDGIDGVRYARASMSDILTFRTVVSGISSVPETMISKRNILHLVQKIRLLAPTMCGESISIKQW